MDFLSLTPPPSHYYGGSPTSGFVMSRPSSATTTPVPSATTTPVLCPLGAWSGTPELMAHVDSWAEETQEIIYEKQPNQIYLVDFDGNKTLYVKFQPTLVIASPMKPMALSVIPQMPPAVKEKIETTVKEKVPAAKAKKEKAAKAKKEKTAKENSPQQTLFQIATLPPLEVAPQPPAVEPKRTKLEANDLALGDTMRIYLGDSHKMCKIVGVFDKFTREGYRKYLGQVFEGTAWPVITDKSLVTKKTVHAGNFIKPN